MENTHCFGHLKEYKSMALLISSKNYWSNVQSRLYVLNRKTLNMRKGLVC